MAQAKNLGLRALLVLLAIFLNAPLLSGLVLCVDRDGQWELEFSMDGKCGPDAGTGQDADLRSPEEETHCVTCTDYSLLLSAGDSIRPTQGWHCGAFQAPVSLAFSPDFRPPKPKSGFSGRSPPREIPFLSHLRTVRLLV